MNRLATTPGLFPLPDWAKTELSARKGRQKSDLVTGDEDEAVTETYERARREVIERQRDIGLSRAVEGQLRWDDMLCHPLAVHDAVSTGGLVRYYDNNNFHREVVVEGDLTFDGDVAAELDAAAALSDGSPLQGVLPGPYSLADLATNDHYGDDETFLAAVASFLAGEIGAFPEIETLFLLEPSLAVRPPNAVDPVVDALDVVVDALDDTRDDASGTDVVVFPYWGTPPEDLYAALLDSRVHGIGYDLVSAPEAAIAQVREYGSPRTVALGVVDAQNTRVETREEIDTSVGSFVDATASVETAYLTTNTEPFYLPENRFVEKLGVLARAASPREVRQ